ncbi:hypothetical protein D3C72_1820050 [compost metagenome]
MNSIDLVTPSTTVRPAVRVLPKNRSNASFHTVMASATVTGMLSASIRILANCVCSAGRNRSVVTLPAFTCSKSMAVVMPSPSARATCRRGAARISVLYSSMPTLPCMMALVSEEMTDSWSCALVLESAMPSDKLSVTSIVS